MRWRARERTAISCTRLSCSRLFQAHIPTYPSGHWLFGFSSRGVHPVRDLNPDWWNSLGLETKYYNTNLHKGAFYLPNYVQKLLEKVEE